MVENTRKKLPLVICVCGMAGSGKSTVAKKVAQKYGLRYFSGGDALMTLARKQGFRPVDRGWWETKEGLRFLEKRCGDPRFDKEVDQKQLEMARHGNIVLDSWTMPWLLENGFKIWLEASLKRRAERIAQRDRIDYDKALSALMLKEKQTQNIYKEMYGFDLGNDFSPFNFILDTEILSAEEVFEVLCKVLDSVVTKHTKLDQASVHLPQLPCERN